MLKHRTVAAEEVDTPMQHPSKPFIRRLLNKIYILDDQEVGQFSDEVPVTCQP